MRPAAAVGVQSAWAMGSHRRKSEAIDAADLPVRLHDASTCVALAIGFLKETEADESIQPQAASRSVAMLKDALATLRAINIGLADRGPAKRSGLGDELAEHATHLGLRLSLRIVGRVDWLSPAHAELIRLTCREALMNTSRHAGAQACEITLDASRCPYLLEARDWGQGISSRTRQGAGLIRLRRLATWLGAELVIASQSGLGTQIVLNGPPCPALATSTPSGLREETSS